MLYQKIPQASYLIASAPQGVMEDFFTQKVAQFQHLFSVDHTSHLFCVDGGAEKEGAPRHRAVVQKQEAAGFLREIPPAFRRAMGWRLFLKFAQDDRITLQGMPLLEALRTAILHTESQSEALRSQAASLEQENAELTDKLENMDNVEGIVDIAGEELGLVDPNTIIFKPGQ